MKAIVANFLLIEALNGITMVQHYAVTSPAMLNCAIIQTVELVELPGEDLILRGSTLRHGKDLAMDSTLLPTLQKLMIRQPVTDSVPQLELGILVTMQFLCVTLHLAEGMAFDTTPLTFLNPHLATIHFMGEVKASWEREN